MSEEMKLLKELVIAHDCSLEYDYVPGKEEALDIFENEIVSGVKVETIEEILSRYQGNSPDNIVNLIKEKIELL